MNQIGIGSDNGLSPIRRQAIIWTSAGLLSIGPLGTSFSQIRIQIQNFSFTNVHLQISSAKWRPFCPGGDEAIVDCLCASEAILKDMGKIIWYQTTWKHNKPHTMCIFLGMYWTRHRFIVLAVNLYMYILISILCTHCLYFCCYVCINAAVRIYI